MIIVQFIDGHAGRIAEKVSRPSNMVGMLVGAKRNPNFSASGYGFREVVSMVKPSFLKVSNKFCSSFLLTKYFNPARQKNQLQKLEGNL